MEGTAMDLIILHPKTEGLIEGWFDRDGYDQDSKFGEVYIDLAAINLAAADIISSVWEMNEGYHVCIYVDDDVDAFTARVEAMVDIAERLSQTAAAHSPITDNIDTLFLGRALALASYVTNEAPVIPDDIDDTPVF